MTSKGFETVSQQSARQLTTTHKSGLIVQGKSPRHLLDMLEWVDVPGGTYRVNKVEVKVKGRGEIPVLNINGCSTVVGSALRAVPIFNYFNDALLDSIAKALKPKTFPRGSVISAENADKDTFYVISKGFVALSRSDDRGVPTFIRSLGVGDYFGEDELLLDQDSAFTTTAQVECEVLMLTSSEVSQIVATDDALSQSLADAIESYKHNRRNHNLFGEKRIEMTAGASDFQPVPSTFIEYDQNPQEIALSMIQTSLKVHTRITDLYNRPFSQLETQLQVTSTYMYEQQEWELINNKQFGLLASCDASMTLQPRYGAPTPDDLDALLEKVWKNPSCFLMHPSTLAAFERECTWRGVPPVTTSLNAATFVVWRGVPIITTDKLEIVFSPDSSGVNKTVRKSSVILMRIGGEDDQGVAGLRQAGIPDEVAPSLAIKRMNIDETATSNYLLTLYFSLAVHAIDALAVLENVDVDLHHDYHDK